MNPSRPLLLLLVPWLGHAAESPAPAAKRSEMPERRSGGGVSAPIAEAIRAQLPAFKPTPPPAPSATVDARSTDVPVILEAFVVAEKKAPSIEEFQMLTKAGQAAYLQKQFPGAVVPGNAPLTESTPNYASQMLRDKRRQDSLRTLGQAAETFRAAGDLTGSAHLKEEMQRTLMRRYDWRDDRLDRTYNKDRR